MKKILCSYFIFFFGISAYSQLLQGEWRDHLPFHEFYRVAVAENIVYCSSKSGLLSYNKTTQEIRKLTKASGIKDFLTDVEVSTISYSEYTKYLVIGYNNGNIDVVDENGNVQNLSDLKNKSLTGSKKINRIIFDNNIAYLACDFGIIAIDLTKMEFKGNYYFGEGGSTIQVNDIAIDKRDIYAATSNGIYWASMESPNLVDYNYWFRLSFIPQFNTEYKFIESFNNQIYTVYTDANSDIDKLITITKESYQIKSLGFDWHLNDLSSSNNYLTFSGGTWGYIYDTNEQPFLVFNKPATNHIFVDSDQKIYVASNSEGFSIQNNESSGTPIQINSPRYRVVSKIETKADQLWVTCGEPDNDSKLYFHGALYFFNNDLWKTYTNEDYPSTEKEYGNTYKMAFDPRNIDHLYVCSERYGILEFLNGVAIKAFDNYNFEPFLNIRQVVGIRAAGLKFDSHNNLWMVLSLVDQPLFKINADGTWENPRVYSKNLNGETKYSDILVTKNDDIWITSNTDGIIVLRDNGTGNFVEKSFAIKNQDGEAISRAYCMEEDHDGNIWIGTNAGPVIYYNPSRVFDISDVSGTQVKIPRNDGTSNADYLLAGETILDIKTDGANRKWIATDKSGVFLISEDGKKTVENFRIENSPLLSNNVSGIGIKENGEVFYATNMGLVSYKGVATTGFDDYVNVYVYPNPVRPDFTGNITVTGLVENSIVKITDVSGNIVYETTSLGGQAIWDGNNFNGKKVASGVYLIFLSTEDGGKSHMTKLLFMH